MAKYKLRLGKLFKDFEVDETTKSRSPSSITYIIVCANRYILFAYLNRTNINNSVQLLHQKVCMQFPSYCCPSRIGLGANLQSSCPIGRPWQEHNQRLGASLQRLHWLW